MCGPDSAELVFWASIRGLPPTVIHVLPLRGKNRVPPRPNRYDLGQPLLNMLNCFSRNKARKVVMFLPRPHRGGRGEGARHVKPQSIVMIRVLATRSRESCVPPRNVLKESPFFEMRTGGRATVKDDSGWEAR